MFASSLVAIVRLTGELLNENIYIFVRNSLLFSLFFPRYVILLILRSNPSDLFVGISWKL